LYGCKCLSKKVDNIYNGDFVVEYFKEELWKKVNIKKN
jgi:hypothetical protein